MNETEEYLLMIFLSDLYEEKLRIEDIEFYQSGKGFLWENFKKEELGRTIPEEFEVFVTDRAIDELRNSNNDIMTWLCRKEWALVKQKIKITVVEND